MNRSTLYQLGLRSAILSLQWVLLGVGGTAAQAQTENPNGTRPALTRPDPERMPMAPNANNGNLITTPNPNTGLIETPPLVSPIPMPMPMPPMESNGMNQERNLKLLDIWAGKEGKLILLSKELFDSANLSGIRVNLTESTLEEYIRGLRKQEIQETQTNDKYPLFRTHVEVHVKPAARYAHLKIEFQLRTNNDNVRIPLKLLQAQILNSELKFFNTNLNAAAETSAASRGLPNNAPPKMSGASAGVVGQPPSTVIAPVSLYYDDQTGYELFLEQSGQYLCQLELRLPVTRNYDITSLELDLPNSTVKLVELTSDRPLVFVSKKLTSDLIPAYDGNLNRREVNLNPDESLLLRWAEEPDATRDERSFSSSNGTLHYHFNEQQVDWKAQLRVYPQRWVQQVRLLVPASDQLVDIDVSRPESFVDRRESENTESKGNAASNTPTTGGAGLGANGMMEATDTPASSQNRTGVVPFSNSFPSVNNDRSLKADYSWERVDGWNRVLIELREPVREAFSLTLHFRRRGTPQPKQRWEQIGRLEVEDTEMQRGYVLLHAAANLRLETSQDQGLRSLTLAQLPPGLQRPQPPPRESFELLRPPANLTVETYPDQPTVRASTEHRLQFEDQQIRWSTSLKLDATPNTLGAVQLLVPEGIEWDLSGAALQPLTDSGTCPPGFQRLSVDCGSSLQTTLTLKRSMPLSESGTLRFHLPHAESSETRTSLIRLAAPRSLELLLPTEQFHRIFPTPTDGQLTPVDNWEATWFDPLQELELKVMRRPSATTSSAIVHVIRQADALAVVAQLTYENLAEGLEQVECEVPPGCVDLRLQGRQIKPHEWDLPGIQTLKLENRSTRCTLFATYLLPFDPSHAGQDSHVPLVRPRPAPDRLGVQFWGPPAWQVTVLGNWHRQPEAIRASWTSNQPPRLDATMSAVPVWADTSTGPVDQPALHCAAAVVGTASEKLMVRWQPSTAFVSTLVENVTVCERLISSGQRLGIKQWRISQCRDRQIFLNVPQGCQIAEIRLDGQPVIPQLLNARTLVISLTTTPQANATNTAITRVELTRALGIKTEAPLPHPTWSTTATDRAVWVLQVRYQAQLESLRLMRWRVWQVPSLVGESALEQVDWHLFAERRWLLLPTSTTVQQLGHHWPWSRLWSHLGQPVLASGRPVSSESAPVPGADSNPDSGPTTAAALSKTGTADWQLWSFQTWREADGLAVGVVHESIWLLLCSIGAFGLGMGLLRLTFPHSLSALAGTVLVLGTASVLWTDLAAAIAYGSQPALLILLVCWLLHVGKASRQGVQRWQERWRTGRLLAQGRHGVPASATRGSSLPSQPVILNIRDEDQATVTPTSKSHRPQIS